MATEATESPIEELFQPPVRGGETVTPLRDYGIGIDVHRRCIQVCCLVKTADGVERFERECSTDWADLVGARQWAHGVLRSSCAHPVLTAELRYTLESTGCYHCPVMLAWGGRPSIVNPNLASPSRRKTDVLDARLPACHSLTGL